VAYLDCEPTYSPPSDDGSAPGQGVRRRRLLTPLWGSVDHPKDAPFSCQFRKGECEFTGPLAAIECS
jgi:hypothetical protein